MTPVKQVLRDLYLEYFNDYVSTQNMANDYNIDREVLITLLEIGCSFHEELVIKNDK